jgi:hypothetical protein
MSIAFPKNPGKFCGPPAKSDDVSKQCWLVAEIEFIYRYFCQGLIVVSHGGQDAMQ